MPRSRPRRLRANRRILALLVRARRAANLDDCGVEPQAAQDAMRVYFTTWVVGPLDAAIAEMKGTSTP